mgnify:CR=1 FL=1
MGLLDKIIDYTTTITGGKYVDEGFDNYGTADDGGSMMSSDAMRHLLWTAEMSRKFSPETAKNVSDWHEKEIPFGFFGGTHNQPEDQKQMDLYNNALGIKIGQKSNSYEDTVRLARETVDSGKAYIINEPPQRNHRLYLDNKLEGLLDNWKQGNR